jgi:hypothetical protein
MTEAQANAALHQATQRIEWEGAHMDAWMQPAPKRQRQRQRATHRTDYVIAATLACVILALTLGVL